MKIGRHLKLDVYGASHAPEIGMRLENFPAGIKIDIEELQKFMLRRAPGNSILATARKEPDIPRFLAGVNGEMVTTGSPIEAIIANTDTRSGDYEKTIPRPGHADYPNYVKYGCIPPGGGSNSGRMTAPMCIAGGICLQELKRRGIAIHAFVEGNVDILAAKEDGDSVGGVIFCRVENLPVGLGGAMFDGIDGAIAQAIFGVPGVKGIEFGNGFKAAGLRGSENNDEFTIKENKVATLTNNHGGVLGGMTSGMPLEFRIAMKPTPSIYKEQKSVDLATMEETTLLIKGRHDPCIAYRAVPVVEALAAFTILDAIYLEEGTVTYQENNLDSIPRLGKCVIDSNVAKLYPDLAKNAIFIVPSGEENKTIHTVAKIWDSFSQAGLGRKDTIVAIGGGVTGDMTGFAAATFMRGIDWINVPTTLLSMIDASYGGKTACDLPGGKNLAGAFHPPRRVIIDTAFLATLPARELKCGKAEMIKHEIIGGAKAGSIGNALPSLDEIRKNLAIKIGIVRADPFEKIGERIKLNTGHTVAHAIEKATNFAVSHGEAVAIGCVEEARIAEKLNLAPKGWAEELAARFAEAGLDTKMPQGLTFENLMPLMKGDKKKESDSIVFALPCGWADVKKVKI